MKKLVSGLLALCLALALLPATAIAATDETVQQTVRAMGIIVGDTSGNMDLDSPVTRAQFAKMMVAASAYKDSVGESSGVSPFSDVKYYHWAAEYIRTAVSAGWLVGYLDGSFKPENGIKTEEAATAVLRMLGYGDAELGGTYPTAQLAKYQGLGLSRSVTAVRGQQVTRRDCMHIFYNLMTATNKTGMVYGTTLGYTITAAGEVDYAALVDAGIKGPFISAGGDLAALVPFILSTGSVYRNGAASQSADADKHDVIYYHENLRTVWIYDSKAVGLFTSASPSAEAPASVVVGGVTYKIGTSSAAYKLSTLGTYGVGDSVTLILGRGGEIVDVLSATEGSAVYHGVVTSTESISYTDAAGQAQLKDMLTIACTDGVSRQYDRKDGSYSVGTVVTVTVENGAAAVKRARSSSLSGTVDKSAKKLGDLTLASNVEILDSAGDGRILGIYASRLAGCKLQSGDISFYTLNSAGEISCLILNDVTGDMATYGVFSSVSETVIDKGEEGTEHIGVYQYVINGTPGSITSDTLLRINVGPASITREGAGISKAKNLLGYKLDLLNSEYAMSESRQITVSQSVQVYLLEDGVYTAIDRAVAENTDKYSLTGYVDSGHALGGHIRIIVAEEK